MPKPAGILYVTNKADPKVLLLHRCAGDHQGTWCTPGGHGRHGESPWDTAARESQEEIGHEPDWHNVRGVHRIGDYAMHVYPVSDEFDPTLNHEHDAAQWSDRDHLPNLHPKLQPFLDAYLDSGGVV